jgi:hypothetical protein
MSPGGLNSVAGALDAGDVVVSLVDLPGLFGGFAEPWVEVGPL